jgi:hypothetical protein
MGAKTQNFGQAFGEGLQGGIQGTRAMGMQNVLMGLRGAQAVGALTDAQIKTMNLKMMFDAFNQMQTEGKKVGTAAEAGASGPAPATSMMPTIAAPGVGGTGMSQAAQPAPLATNMQQTGASPQQTVAQPQGNEQQQLQIPNSNWPPWLHSQANALRIVRPDLSKELDSYADTISSKGITSDVNGRPVQIPSYARLNQQVEAQKTTAVEGAKLPFDLGPEAVVQAGPQAGAKYPQSKAEALGINGAGASSAPGQPAQRALTSLPLGAEESMKTLQAQDTAVQKATPQIAQQLQRFDRISKIMETFQPGTFASEKANIVGALRSMGINVPDTATANAQAFQEFLKDTTANAMTGVQQMGGGRVLLAEIMAFTKATAAPTLQPGANANIIAQSTGILNQTKDYYNAYLDWRQNNPMATTTDAARFENNWYSDKQNSLNNYIKESLENIPYLGMPVPNGKNGVQPVVGKAYNTNGGIYRWNGKQMVLERRAGGD